jgi:nucleoside-diphosphate-sugar epimerase
MKQSQDYFLLTGATGLLGQYMTRDLLAAGHRVAILIRGNKKQTPSERMEAFMQMWERQAGTALPRPVCLEGNITEPNAGLSESDFAWVKANCGNAIHCAASLQFREHNGEPWRTNVEGTKHVLQMCNDAQIKTMHYISTAYVCGHRDTPVMEDELNVGQKWRNEYEDSKFQAEQLVRDAGFESLTVYRPVVITGDAVTGYTSTYHGTYLYMKLAKMLANNTEPDENGVHHIPIRWGLTGDERRNITPVDWNSEIICQLINNKEAHGKTFHLAPSEPITMHDAITFGTKYFNITGIEFCGFGRKPDVELNDLEKWVWAAISIYGAYDFMDPVFDTTNLMKYAPEPKCPKLDWDIAKKLIDYAEEDRWGKRKPTPPTEPTLCVLSLLKEESKKEPVAAIQGDDLLGVNVLGPGGGQWQLSIDGDSIAGFAPGFPLSEYQATTATIDIEDLAAGINDGRSLLDIFRQTV